MSEEADKDIPKKINAILKYRMGIKHPELLSDEEYDKAYAAYIFLRQHDREFYLGIGRQLLNELFEGQDNQQQ